jgi:hypothetical protein
MSCPVSPQNGFSAVVASSSDRTLFKLCPSVLSNNLSASCRAVSANSDKKYLCACGQKFGTCRIFFLRCNLHTFCHPTPLESSSVTGIEPPSTMCTMQSRLLTNYRNGKTICSGLGIFLIATVKALTFSSPRPETSFPMETHVQGSGKFWSDFKTKTLVVLFDGDETCWTPGLHSTGVQHLRRCSQILSKRLTESSIIQLPINFGHIVS